MRTSPSSATLRLRSSVGWILFCWFSTVTTSSKHLSGFIARAVMKNDVVYGAALCGVLNRDRSAKAQFGRGR